MTVIRYRCALVAAGLALLSCDAGLAPHAAATACPAGFVGVCGTVTFKGALPESTDAVYVVAFPTFPRSRADLFTFKPFPPMAGLALDSAARAQPQFYSVPLPEGRYEWVVAAWLKQGFTVDNADSTLREAGYYRGGGDTTSNGSGIVQVSGTGVDSVDFVVDFTNMHPVSFYFPPLAARP
ncbi:MAG: hypothetical protein ACREMW_04060 [Gemmatimonadales bacterium]